LADKNDPTRLPRMTFDLKIVLPRHTYVIDSSAS